MKRNLGSYFIAALIAVNVLLWIFLGPTTGKSTNFPLQKVAETFSSSAIILMACSQFLANKPVFLEPYFGGLDRMYVVHKNINMLGILLLLVHVIIVPNSGLSGPGLWLGWITFPTMLLLILLTIAPRMPLVSQFIRLAYHQWKKLHKYMGLLFIMGLTHALMVEPLILHSRPLTFYVGTIAVIGVCAYLYKEFLWDRFKRHYAYEVVDVKKLNGTVAEVTLQARDRRLAHRAGQFLYVHFDGDPLLKETHPFTISSAPGEDHLRLSIKASGDWTQYLHEHLKPGTAAYVEGPHGEFNFKTGSAKQIWIAGGIGITPFLSWMRDFEAAPHGREIDFYYTTAVPEEALFLNEIEKAGRAGGFRAHVSHSVRDGRLSADKVVASSGDPGGKDIYMCGPGPMVEAFRRALTARGVPPGRIHYEEFNFR
jgi:predicted ferric reductase